MNAKEYEILFIIKPTLTEDARKTLLDNFKSWITDAEGQIQLFQEVGLKDLATEFDKQTRGYYVLVEFTATQKTLDNLKEKLHINEDIFRHLIVKMDSVRPKEGTGKSKKAKAS